MGGSSPMGGSGQLGPAALPMGGTSPLGSGHGQQQQMGRGMPLGQMGGVGGGFQGRPGGGIQGGGGLNTGQLMATGGLQSGTPSQPVAGPGLLSGMGAGPRFGGSGIMPGQYGGGGVNTAGVMMGGGPAGGVVRPTGVPGAPGGGGGLRMPVSPSPGVVTAPPPPPNVSLPVGGIGAQPGLANPEASGRNLETTVRKFKRSSSRAGTLSHMRPQAFLKAWSFPANSKSVYL